MPGYLEPAMPSIISGIALMLVGALVGWFSKKYKDYKKNQETIEEMRESFTIFIQEHKTNVLAIKNITRATILDMCDRAMRRGYMSDNHFKCLCELEESYHLLHGNSYVDEVIQKTKEMYRNQDIPQYPELSE